MSEKPGASGDWPPRVIVDTNLFVRALLKNRLARPLLEAFLTARFQLVTSEALLDELAEVLDRPKFHDLIEEVEARELLELVGQRAIVVEPVADPPECRDPDDRVVLATAISGRVRFIVTGDLDLRADDRLCAEMLGFGVEILGVEGFLERLETMTKQKTEEPR